MSCEIPIKLGSIVPCIQQMTRVLVAAQMIPPKVNLTVFETSYPVSGYMKKRDKPTTSMFESL